MKICIIGAGQSGLVTCKTFTEQNNEVLVFEKSNSNGLFSKIPEGDYFRWSSSRYVSGYSDFPIPDSYPTWMSLNQYSEYINHYKTYYNLDKYIYYSTEVISCKEIKKNKWLITYKYNNKKNSQIFDKLIICTGLNSTPKYPDLGNYSGKILHSDDIYRKMNKNDWKNNLSQKKILLIGGGESAFDIGALCLKYTDKLYYTTKTYVEWFPDWGSDDDFIKNNKQCFKKLGWGESIHKHKLPSDTHLSYLEYSLPTPASGFWHRFGRNLILKKTWKLKTRCSHNHKELCDITKTPDGLFNKYVVKRFPFLCDMHNDKVNIVKYPKSFSGKSIFLENDNIDDIDIIICATGYKKEFKFLDEKYYKSDLIKKIIPYKYHNIAFIGFARPTMGSIVNVAEMQSWWASMFFNNEIKIKNRNYKWARPENPIDIQNDFVNTIVIGNYYYKDLALDMNISPNLTYIFLTDPLLWKQIMHTTLHPVLFRLNGKFKHPDARFIILNNFPKFSQKKELYIYYIMFTIFHLIYIMSIILLSYIFFKLFVFNKNKSNRKFYIIVLLSAIICILYTYNFWY